MNEFRERSVAIAHCSALWYAWGQIDREPTFTGSGVEMRFTLDHGQEFGLLFEHMTRELEAGERTASPSVLDAWKEFVRSKGAKGVNANLEVDDIDPHVRLSREAGR